MMMEQRHKIFEDDVNGVIGRFVPVYRGRSYYVGPAVEIDKDDLQDLIRSTGVRLQWDDMGKTRLIVYPV